MKGRPISQNWVHELTMMQQTVVLEILRGPDGLTKYHKSKYLLRWYRRCVVFSAMDGTVLTTPIEAGGGSFTGPSYDEADVRPWEEPMKELVSEVIRSADELPHHFYRHMMHGIEIVGYKHSDTRIRAFWRETYERLARDLHLNPETEAQLDFRLGDVREQWIAAGDEATLA